MEKFQFTIPTPSVDEESGNSIEKKNKSAKKSREVDEIASFKKQRKKKEAKERMELGRAAKRFLVFSLFVVVAVIALMIYRLLVSYTDYDVRISYDRVDSEETQFLDYKGNQLKYSPDGVFYARYNGDIIWSYSFDMTSPKMAYSDNFIVVYDSKGNEADLFTQSGYIHTYSMNMNITSADISSQGIVAFLMRDDEKCSIQLMDHEGNIVAAGELDPSNSGYAVDVALSENATKMAVSLINLNGGTVKTDINIYNFSSSNRQSTDHLQETHSFSDVLFPEIDFVKNDRLVCIGDKEIVTFKKDFSSKHEIFFDDEVKSVFHNDRYIGFVEDGVNENGMIVDMVSLYSIYGNRLFKKEIDVGYDTVYLTNSDEIVFTASRAVGIYTKFGIKRFEGNFDNAVYQVVPSSFKRYIIVEDKITQEIKLL